MRVVAVASMRTTRSAMARWARAAVAHRTEPVVVAVTVAAVTAALAGKALPEARLQKPAAAAAANLVRSLADAAVPIISCARVTAQRLANALAQTA